MTTTRGEYAIALLEENDWQTKGALLALKARLIRNYTDGVKSLSEIADIAMAVALEIHDQAELHEQAIEKDRVGAQIRELIKDFLPHRETPA